MEEAIALIEQIIEEHRQIIRGLQALERVTNDADALKVLDKAQGDFVPGRLGDHQPGLQSWRDSLEVTDQGMRAHFNREEISLLPVIENHGSETQVSSWRAWLSEHEELRNHLAVLKKELAELTAEHLSRKVWEERAWGIRVYMSQTHRLFHKHTRGEQKLLLSIKKGLQEKIKMEQQT
jgi:hypothetical protein